MGQRCSLLPWLKLAFATYVTARERGERRAVAGTTLSDGKSNVPATSPTARLARSAFERGFGGGKPLIENGAPCAESPANEGREESRTRL